MAEGRLADPAGVGVLRLVCVDDGHGNSLPFRTSYAGREPCYNQKKRKRIQRFFPAASLEAAASGDSLDWKEISASEITQRVTSKVQPGSIILFHNAALHTPEALPAMLEYLLQEGYTIVPISQLILTGEYTMDHTGRQCPAGMQ